MLYPLSYEGKYWVFNYFRDFANEPAQRQHNLEEGVPALRDASPLFKHVRTEPRERWVLVKPRQVKVTVAAPTEYPDRKMSYVIRCRLNGHGYWRSYSTKRGANGAEAFHAKLKVAMFNEQSRDSRTGLPTSVSPPSELNLAKYYRSFIQDQCRRLSPSSRRSYVEAMTSFVFNCARNGARPPLHEWRQILASWMTPRVSQTVASNTVD